MGNAFQCLQQSPSLSFLEADYDDADIMTLCDVLAQAQTIKLSLVRNRISSEGSQRLCETLISAGILKDLRLEYNRIEQSDSIVQLIKELPSLVHLSCQCNYFCQDYKQVELVRDTWVSCLHDIRQLQV